MDGGGVVKLPWPDKRLNPNARVHWSVLGRVKADAKTSAWAITREAGHSTMEGPVTLSLRFCPPDRRGRDIDNAFASMKAAIDGISQAIGIDDKHFGYSIAWGEPTPGGAVHVDISAPQEGVVNIPFRGVIS